MNDQLGPRPVDDVSPAGDDTVALLLQVAGHRPDVPEADAAIVKAAAREQWQRTVWVNRRRKVAYRVGGTLLAAAASVLLVLGLGIDDAFWPTLEEPIAQVAHFVGTSPEVEIGREIRPGETLETRGGLTSVALNLTSGAALRLVEGTQLRLDSASVLALEHGTVHVESNDAKIEIHTRLGIVSNLGTRFKVGLEPGSETLEIKVHEGQVEWQDGAGRSQITRAGEQLAVGSGEAPEPQAHAAFASGGRTVRAVLDDVAREAGWVIEFADAALEAEISSPGLILGSRTPVGPGLDHAVAQLLLLAGNTAEHRVDGWVLRIERRG